MDSKRILLAITLSLVVIFGYQAVFRPTPPTTTTQAQTDSVQGNPASAAATESTTNATPGVATALPSLSAADSSVPVVPVDTAVIATRPDSGATFTLTSVGATPIHAVMNAYDNRSTGAGQVDLANHRPLFKYQIVTNSRQQLDLSKTVFAKTGQSDTSVTYQTATSAGTITLTYAFGADGHTAAVTGRVEGGDGKYLLVTLPETFDVVERDSSADLNVMGFSYESKRDGSKNILFRSLDPGEREIVEGPVNWVAAKTKYFVAAVIVPEGGTPFDETVLIGGPRVAKHATQGTAQVLVPITNGTFAFDMYAGPQEWRRLHNLGRNFESVNPYGWAWMRGVLQPIATGVIRFVLWLHRELHLSYGLVLIALGIFVRIVLWPLNQVAMRASLKMQDLQPELQEVQKRYKDDPNKLREEMMKLYKSHGMTPFSPLMGCLPMLLPMPVLFALFFVFQNTIEFRGVSFLWLNDLSAHDPIYILPVIMALSMLGLSWLGMRGMPPNPQAKMMMYLMPGMFLIFLGRAAAGLNLYYAAQNLAALPQQWLLTKERAKQHKRREERKTQQAAEQAKLAQQRRSGKKKGQTGGS